MAKASVIKLNKGKLTVNGELHLKPSEVRPATLKVKVARTLLRVNSAGNTATATGLIPDKAIVLGIVGRNTTALTGSGGFASYSVGDGVTADLWGTGIVKAKGTTFDADNWKSTWTPFKHYTAANNVVLTANGAETFTDGYVELQVLYLDVVAPTGD